MPVVKHNIQHIERTKYTVLLSARESDDLTWINV